MPFSVKICGITSVADASAAVEFGADAIGLNFYSKSKRFVSLEAAAEIRLRTENQKCVGVFVNEEADRINSISETLGLDYAQLHGDEAPSLIKSLKPPVIRALRITNQEFEAAIAEAAKWRIAGAAALLLDAANEAQYGGTGQTLDWHQVAKLNLELPIILAGGLNCDNVTQAIETIRPTAVDVASGVESSPGRKNDSLMRKFIENARAALKQAAD